MDPLEFPGEEGGVAALRMAPNDKLVRGAGIAQLADGTDGIEDGTGLAGADEIGVRRQAGEAGIIGGNHDKALGHHAIHARNPVVDVGLAGG